MARTVDAEVVRVLNEVLTGELTAINQYFLHARMLRNWGYKRLAKTEYRESIDEMKHADELIERVLYLGGVPNVQRLGKVMIGESVQEMLQLDLQLEYDAVPRVQAGIKLCRERDDAGSARVLEDILESEEEHIDWLEAQLQLIAQMGLAEYLSTQVHEDES